LKSRASKARLRAHYKRARNQHVGLAPELSQKICERLQALDAQVIAVYSALPGEVSVCAAVDAWLAAGKTILYPRVIGPGKMVLISVQNRNELSEGRFGIMEPDGRPWTEQVDVVLVPGLAFDLAGHRLGFGAGFYDRFVEASSTRRLGVAFDWQMTRKLPSEDHDQPMDVVLTDRRVYRGERVSKSL
jgi:5-formyltetrahydrofolate cyclo-ligase